jgi:Holliday junction resolvasome RuvABC endonuclease subunit
MSGSEMQREKEKVAAKMREKQAAGIAPLILDNDIPVLTYFPADAKKAAEGAAGGKKK